MKDRDFKKIQLTFQLHKLISEGKIDSDESDVIRDQLDDYDPESILQENQLSCWCYALYDKEKPEVYHDILFGSLYGTYSGHYEEENKEFRAIQLCMQSHWLIAHDQHNSTSKLSGDIFDEECSLETYCEVYQMNQLSCWCYALTNIDKGEPLEKVYRDILFGTLYGDYTDDKEAETADSQSK